MSGYEIADRGSGRIRPIKRPTYAQIFALPDGADFVLMANVRERDVEAMGVDPGVYTSGHTMEPGLRQNWTDKLGDHAPETTCAGDLLLYVLPEGYTSDVPVPGSTLSAEEIATALMKDYRAAIFECGAGGPQGAIDLLRTMIADAVERARQGYVLPPF